jgi:hypothetical protein
MIEDVMVHLDGTAADEVRLVAALRNHVIVAEITE